MLRTSALLLLLTLPLGTGVQKKRRTNPIVDRYIVVSISGSHGSVCIGNQNKQLVNLTANATDPMQQELLYEWSVTVGKLSGSGRSVDWDLSEVAVGSYKVTVKVSSKKLGSTESSVEVRVVECEPSLELILPPCQTVIVVECPAETTFDRLTKFVVKVSGAPKDASLSYWWKNWGKIVSGEGTDTIEVQLKERWGENLIATVDVIGAADPSCFTEASCTSKIKPD